MWWAIIACSIIYILYITLIKPLSYWKDRNLSYIKPWPLLGNMLPVLMMKKSLTESIQDSYNAFPGKRCIGVFAFRKPQLVVRDLNLIKQIAIKDFDHFMNRTVQINEDAEPIFAKNLVLLEGQKWRDMRASLSPTFTSSKMRFLFNLVSDCAQQFVKHFEDQNFDVLEVDTKDVCTRFTNDAIATAVFGISLNSFNDRENEFLMSGKDVSSFSGVRTLKFIGYSLFPALMRLLKVSMFPAKLSQFFTKIVKDNIHIREEKGLIRPDMIHILLQARRGTLMKEEKIDSETGYAVAQDTPIEDVGGKRTVTLSDEDIVAQAMIFFFGGFETTSTLLCFMSHELAVNPDIQIKLQQEIDKVLSKCDGKVTYETLLGMKYLDMVVSESLRMWTPGVALERICVKDYIINSEEGEDPLLIEKGLSVSIPVFAIHRDPKYFPNPDKFDPERFSDENKHNIEPFSYMPFGVGPRNCIASRFALMETKILFFYLLSKFDLVTTKKTVIPLVLTRKKFLLAPDGGFWVGLRPRNSTA